MSTSMSWMAWFFQDKGLILRGLARVEGGEGRKCSWPERVPRQLQGKGAQRQGKVRSSDPSRGTAWRSCEGVEQKGGKLPAGVGRDKTQPSLKVILPDTCTSTSLLPPTSSPFASGMKNNSITWNQVNMLPTTTGITIRWAPDREVQNLWL